MLKLIVKGEASQTIILSCPLQMSSRSHLLEFLENKKIPMASTCQGAGVCQKCTLEVIGPDGAKLSVLSCQTTLADLKKWAVDNVLTVSVSYL